MKNKGIGGISRIKIIGIGNQSSDSLELFLVSVFKYWPNQTLLRTSLKKCVHTILTFQKIAFKVFLEIEMPE